MPYLKTKFNQIMKLLTNRLFWLVILSVLLLISTNYNVKAFFYNAILSMFTILIFALVTNRLSFSLFFTTLLTLALYLSCCFKVNLLNSTLNREDLVFLFNIFDFSGADLIVSYMNYPFLFGVIISGILLAYIYSKSPLFIIFGKIDKYRYASYRLIMIVTAFSIGYSSLVILKSPETLLYRSLRQAKDQRHEYCQIVYGRENKQKVYCNYIGPFADILVNMAENQVWSTPVSETSELVKSITKYDINEQSSKAEHIDNSNHNSKPDIILVLNESTFNPIHLGYKFASKLKYPFFNDEKHTKAHGLLNVHTIGGGSSQSEYPAVTGIVHSVFSGPNSYPFITLAKHTKVSLIQELKKQGYYTIIVYPVDKKFVNAEEAYNLLGADRIVDIKDYNFKPNKWRDVPDSKMAELIVHELKIAPKNKPVFIFAATMINHGPHDSSQPDIIECSLELPKNTCGKINDYINRLESTNRDFLILSDKLMQRSKHTVFFNFGDHLPSFEGAISNLKFDYDATDEPNYFRTFYNIRTNFELKDNYSYPVMDISYIPSVLLDIIGDSKVDEFYQASSLLRRNCNGAFYQCADQYPELTESFKAYMIEQLGLEPQVISIPK